MRENVKRNIRRYMRTYLPELRLRAMRVIAANTLVACAKCGFADMRALQLDHVAGDGTADRKMRGPISMLLAIVRGENHGQFQILCANCNWIKRCENNEALGRPRLDDGQISLLDQWPLDDPFIEGEEQL